VAGNLAVGTYVGQSAYQINEASGVTLTAYVAGPPAVRANGDTGAFTSNRAAIDPVPAFTLQLPAAFGPGQDNWALANVQALTVLPADNTALTAVKLFVTKALVPNVNPAPVGSSITNANAEVIVQNLAGSVASALTIRMILEHTIVR
jgi:hypothetical protein